jgi:Asp/Glu/hydantoin racemase
MMPRIALIHALAHSVAPINEEMARQWRECERMNLLDDSLSADLARSPNGLDAAMHDRFFALADYAVSTGAQGLLFTCSAFGPCIEAVARRCSVPVLKPNEAMISEAVQLGRRIGLIATFAPTLQSMPAEFPSDVELLPVLAEGALDALNAADLEQHDELIARAALNAVAQGADVVALAQFSMARAEPVVRAAMMQPVITTVGSAIRAMRLALGRSQDRR